MRSKELRKKKLEQSSKEDDEIKKEDKYEHYYKEAIPVPTNKDEDSYLSKLW